ncbi:MAG: hypothetical protein JRJ85_25190, partial [Deltaproteobacteria bacterium]|nr:hypothetical protein [Deltaproteobacteria bacterium]
MSDRPLIYIQDGVVINQPAKKEILSDAKDLILKDNGAVLSIEIDATHSGLLTNGRVYPAVRVRRGYKSYFSTANGGSADYDKPILKFHDDREDPIGRIVGGQFLKLKSGDAFKNDFLTPDIPGKDSGRGSGVVRVTANIMDPDAIQKIIDGRLLSVSSGHHTDKMTCNLCGKQLFYGFSDTDEICEHIPLRVYNDEHFKGMCWGITGNLFYDELSMLPSPAQSPSMIVKIDWEDAKQVDAASEGKLVLSCSDRAKKTQVQSMVLHDDCNSIDLLTARKTDMTNKVSVSFDREKVISSVLDGLSSENDWDSDIAESESNDTTQDTGIVIRNSRIDNGTNANRATSEDPDAVEDDHQDSDQEGEGSVRTDSTDLGDGETNFMAKETKKPDTSVESPQEGTAQLQLDLQGKEKEITDLKATVEKKDAEITRLTGDSAKMQNDLARDYATLVAKYRTLLNKPGAGQ